jgi:hypothetical protein
VFSGATIPKLSIDPARKAFVQQLLAKDLGLVQRLLIRLRLAGTCSKMGTIVSSWDFHGDFMEFNGDF